MNATELRAKSVDELDKELLEQLEWQFKLRLKKNTGQLTQTHELKKTRREIARIKTVLSEKVLREKEMSEKASAEKAGN